MKIISTDISEVIEETGWETITTMITTSTSIIIITFLRPRAKYI
jgi:hypothetical protein